MAEAIGPTLAASTTWKYAAASETQSDALFAEFCLGRSLPLSTIQDLLDLLLNPCFNLADLPLHRGKYANGQSYQQQKISSELSATSTKTDALLADFLDDLTRKQYTQFVLESLIDPRLSLANLSFKRAEDIDPYISNHRREIATRHSFLMTTPIAVPIIVVEGVADRFAEDIDYFLNSVDGPNGRDDQESAGRYVNALVNMSLVHRSWTHAAHSALRLRFLTLRSHLRSPLCGPWVRCFDYRQTSLESHENTGREPLALFSHTPRLQVLAVKWAKGQAYFGSEHATQFIHCIGTLPLRGLHIDGLKDIFCNAFLEALSSMQTLESLTLAGEIRPAFLDTCQPIPESILQLSPPPSLKTISLLTVLSTEQFCWLVEPRNGYCPECMVLEFYNDWYDPIGYLMPALFNTAPFLQSLGFKHVGFVWPSQTARIRVILARCTSLEDFRLHTDG